MVTRAIIDDFVAQRSLALVGASRSGKGFGNLLRKELTRRGYALRLVHPAAETIDGLRCASGLGEVAAEVGGVILVTPPAATIELVREAAAAGLRRVWIQQGAESEEAIRCAEEHGLAVVHHECLMMFLQPSGFPHSLHRWLRKLFGRLPR